MNGWISFSIQKWASRSPVLMRQKTSDWCRPNGKWREKPLDVSQRGWFQSSPAPKDGRYGTTSKTSSIAELECFLRELRKILMYSEAPLPSYLRNLLLIQSVRVIAILLGFLQHSRFALTTPTAPQNRPPYSLHRPAHISLSARSSGTPEDCPPSHQ